MSREQVETFSQDRSGNVNRDIDPIRGQGGMLGQQVNSELGMTARGLTEIASPDTGVYQDLMVLFPDAGRFNVEEIHIFNSGDSEGTYTLYEAISKGMAGGQTEPQYTEQRSVPINVPAGSTKVVSYTGKEFGDIQGDRGTNTDPYNFPLIQVMASEPGFVGIGGYVRAEEEVEPTSEKKNPRPDGFEFGSV